MKKQQVTKCGLERKEERPTDVDRNQLKELYSQWKTTVILIQEPYISTKKKTLVQNKRKKSPMTNLK